MTWLSDLPLLLKGGAIGLAISVPVGPIGVLCIQRTLAGGRIVGLVSGLGAATADAIYAAVAALGLVFISETLIGRQPLLRLIGGGILILLGIRILLSRPPEESAPEERVGLGGAYVSTFVLTLTNPLTILFVAAIFAGLGAATESGELTEAAPLVLGVFLGSALWWFLLSGGVSLFRDRVTPKMMRWINLGSGTIIASFGAAAVIASTAIASAPTIVPIEPGVQETVAIEPQDAAPPGSASTSNSIVDPAYGFTYQQQDGNRIVAGKGQLPQVEPVDIPLGGTPVWLVAAPMREGSVWVAILDDGRAEAFYVTGGTVEPVPIEPSQLPVGMPPMLLVEDGVPKLLTSRALEASDLTHAVTLTSPVESTATITGAGDLAFETSGEMVELSINALPDARLLLDGKGQMVLLTDPTTRYGHGVLGDSVEAASITLIDTASSPPVASRLEIDSGKVIEGIAPIWADLDGDGAREIIVTESNAEQGAQIVAYDEQGSRVATGPAIGTGFRWRHQLAVAPFGPGGELELASVLTPHIGGIVEFYRMQGDELEIVAQVPGYSSHEIGSRNLDRALAGDLDGDGRIELLVPDQAQESLGAIRRTNEGAETAWSIPLDGRLSTNLAAVTLPDGVLALGAGLEEGLLRLWLP